MVSERVYPDRFEMQLNEFTIADQDQIRKKYNELYDQRIEGITNQVRIEFEDNIVSNQEHCKLLSCCILPFVKGELDGYEVLFVDPLKFAKENGEIDEIPTFDLLLGKFQGYRLITIIFCEVKSQSSKNDITKEVLLKYRTDARIRAKLDELIKRKLKKNYFIDLELQMEFVLVGCRMIGENFIQSIQGKEIPILLWLVECGFMQPNIHISIIEDFGAIHESRAIVDFFKKTFFLRKVVQFTYILDPNVILMEIAKDYMELSGKELDNRELEKMIMENGAGVYYDDPRIMDYLIGKIKQTGLALGILKQVNTRLSFIQVDIRERIISKNLEKRMKSLLSQEILNSVLEIVQPKRKGLYSFIPFDKTPSPKPNITLPPKIDMKRVKLLMISLFFGKESEYSEEITKSLKMSEFEQIIAKKKLVDQVFLSYDSIINQLTQEGSIKERFIDTINRLESGELVEGLDVDLPMDSNERKERLKEISGKAKTALNKLKRIQRDLQSNKLDI